MCINPRVSSLAAAGKHRLMLFDQHIREDVCLDNQDLLRILKLCSDKFLSKFLPHNLRSALSFRLNANIGIKFESSLEVPINKSKISFKPIFTPTLA